MVRWECASDVCKGDSVALRHSVRSVGALSGQIRDQYLIILAVKLKPSKTKPANLSNEDIKLGRRDAWTWRHTAEVDAAPASDERRHGRRAWRTRGVNVIALFWSHPTLPRSVGEGLCRHVSPDEAYENIKWRRGSLKF